MIDRFSRWPEAVPLPNIEALTVCRAFVDTWISRYGSPETLTTDQGSQFESRLFTALLQLTGCHRIRTTAYHPPSNGMIERWHRSFKAAIMCHANMDWSRSLSTVLLGLRSHVLDTGASPAEYMFGTTLRIPGEFVLPDDFASDPHTFLEEFREHMRKVKPVPIAQKYKLRSVFYKDLPSSSHVFLHVGAARGSLERPYTGPHKVIRSTSDKVYEIDVCGTPRQVPVEHLKPAYLLREPTDNNAKTGDDNSNQTNVPTIKTYTRKKRVTFNV